MTDCVGIFGAGLIGQSWAALFAAQGARVIVVDPRPKAAAEVARFAAGAWPHLRALGLARADHPPQIETAQDAEALRPAGFVQENLPDRLEVKRAALRDLERAIAPEVVVASSTSALMASDIQAGARHPERILVGHPMNPPHLIPLVELVAGKQTAPDAVDRAEAFYLSMQRAPVRIRRELPGHLANRLTAALYREAVHLVAEGVADVAEVDRAIAMGPGLRWALMGPHLIYHLGGGAGGYAAYLDHLGPAQQARWNSLGAPQLTEALKAELVAGVQAELGSATAEDIATRRDAALVALAALKRTHGF